MERTGGDHSFLGELDRAAVLGEEARTIAEAHGERWAHAYATYVLALVALTRGEYDQATIHGQECLRTVRAFNDLLGIALAVEMLAWIAASAGHRTPDATDPPRTAGR